MRYFTILVLGLTFTGCQPASDAVAPESLHPFVGCWENENGLERESWTIDPSGWLIGYAASRDAEGNVTYFEHMRIERGDAEVLVVTGQENSKTRFVRRKTDTPDEFRFENPEHDYPQLIVYRRQGDALKAYIDLIAGGKRVRFDKNKCG